MEKSRGLGFSQNHRHGDPQREFLQNIGIIVRRRRIYFGLSQEELGQRVGVTGRLVKMVESGTKTLSLYVTSRFCAVLDLKLHDLQRPWQDIDLGEPPPFSMPNKAWYRKGPKTRRGPRVSKSSS
jgi:ribosome-binding protein aMBF1 (putative translation factor)